MKPGVLLLNLARGKYVADLGNTPGHVQHWSTGAFLRLVRGYFDVVEVRTLSVKSKPKRRGYTAGRTRAWKKAIVQVRPGQSIPIFQGLEADL